MARASARNTINSRMEEEGGPGFPSWGYGGQYAVTESTVSDTSGPGTHCRPMLLSNCQP